MLFRNGRCRLLAILFIIATASAGAAQSTPAQTPPKTKLELYGFVMTDFGYDMMSINPDWFDVMRPSKLPAFDREFGANGRTFAGVRQTRFGVNGTQDTRWGELNLKFEFDFFGVGVDTGVTTIRPRHFYGEIGAFGAGQTHSPFMDIDIFPNTLEYWGPNGMVFFRNVQVRWMPVRGDTRVTLALERPGSTQDPGILSNRIEIQNVRGRFQYPDVSGEFRYGGSNGTYVEAAGIVRNTKLDDLLVDNFNLNDSITGWGVSLSSNVKFGKDTLRLQYVIGEGIQNYMNDAPVDIAAEPNFGDPTRPIRGVAIPMQSLVAFLDHYWSDKWSTSVGYSQLVMDNTILQTRDAFHRGQYASANLLYTPFENVMYGGELQWGRRTNFADGFHSNDYKLQLSFKYNFSKELF
jgi:hypothetical protein